MAHHLSDGSAPATETPSALNSEQVALQRRAKLRIWDPAAAVAAVLLGALDAVGFVADDTNVFELPVTPGRIESGIWQGVWTALIVYIVARVIFLWADALDRRWRVLEPASDIPQDSRWRTFAEQAKRVIAGLLARQPTSTLTDALHRRFWVYLVLVLLAWTPWLVLTWPGAMRDDTIAQYLQTEGALQYYTQHPLLDTLIFGGFWKFGEAVGNPLAGLGAYAICQMLLMAAGTALVACYLRKRGVPRLVEYAAVVFVALSYVVVGSTTTMGKDSLHAVVAVPLAILFVEACLTRGEVLKRWPVLISFTVLLALAIATKRTALPIAAGSLLVLVLIASRVRWRVLAAGAVGFLGVLLIWQPVAAAVTGAVNTPSREVWGLITQPLARVEAKHPGAITDAERAETSGLMDLSAATELYAPWRTDETVWSVNPGAATSEKIAAIRAWATVGARYPVEYAKAYVGYSYGWFYTGTNFTYPTDSDYLFTPEYMEQWANMAGDPVTAQRLLQPLQGTSEKPTWMRDSIEWINEGVSEDPFQSIGLYVTTIPVLIFAYLISRRRWTELAASSMLGLTVLSLYLSPMTLFWYPIPLYLLLPLFAGLVFSVPVGKHLERKPLEQQHTAV